jgi:hypothetical protein
LWNRSIHCSYSFRIEILVAITFFYNFDHSSYSKNCASTIYFVCYMLYYCMYCKLDLSFYTFVIIFWIWWIVRVARKSQQRQIFWYEWSTTKFKLQSLYTQVLSYLKFGCNLSITLLLVFGYLNFQLSCEKVVFLFFLKPN